MRWTQLSKSVGLFTLMFVAQGFAANVHEPPLGFITTDISPERWAQLNPEYRFKGKVGDTLRFEQIQDVYVIRCFMHVLNRAHIQKTVEDAIPAESEFLSGAIPEKLWRAKEPLTVLVHDQEGEVGLMNIYAGVTIVEMNSRYGAVGNGHGETSGAKARGFLCG